MSYYNFQNLIRYRQFIAKIHPSSQMIYLPISELEATKIMYDDNMAILNCYYDAKNGFTKPNIFEKNKDTDDNEENSHDVNSHDVNSHDENSYNEEDYADEDEKAIEHAWTR